MRQQADRKKAQLAELGSHGKGLSPIFPLASVLSAGVRSRLCASLRPLRGAKNAALTNLPLRSCVASSYRKNARNKWGRGTYLEGDTIAATVIAMVLTVSLFFKLSSRQEASPIAMRVRDTAPRRYFPRSARRPYHSGRSIADKRPSDHGTLRAASRNLCRHRR